MNLIHAVLFRWHSDEAKLRAVAYVLHETLVRYRAHIPPDLMDRTMADLQTFPITLLPRGCRPPGAPDDEHVILRDLLWLLSQAVPSESQEEKYEFATVVQALFLIMLAFDGRVQSLVGQPAHTGAHPALGTHPPTTPEMVALLGPALQFPEQARRFIVDIQGAPSDGHRQRLTLGFVNWTRELWRLTIEGLPE